MSGSAKRAWLLAALVCALVVVADQASKAVAEAQLVVGEHVDVLGPLQLTLAHNDGVAFGLAGGGGALLVALTVVALGFVLALFAREPQRRGIWLAVGLLAGGALGNLIDRVRLGEVTDFVDLLSWPPFNLADVAVTAGVIALALSYLFEDARG